MKCIIIGKYVYENGELKFYEDEFNESSDLFADIECPNCGFKHYYSWEISISDQYLDEDMKIIINNQWLEYINSMYFKNACTELMKDMLEGIFGILINWNLETS